MARKPQVIGVRDPTDVNHVRLGSTLRAIRLQSRLRQLDVAARAGVCQQTISRIESGQSGPLSLDSIEAVAQALGADLTMGVHWRGSALPRLLDRRHAALQEAATRNLAGAGWEVRVEQSFNRYGERGSVDVLAWRADRRALLIVEIKSELVDLQETVRVLDMKARVVPVVVRRENGWQPAAVAVVLVLPAATVHRSAVERHAAILAAALPARTRDIRRWLVSPTGSLRGILFVRNTHPQSGTDATRPTRRVRRQPNGRQAAESGR